MKKKLMFIILGVVVFLLISSLTAYILIKKSIHAYLVDGDEVLIPVFNEYKDPGIILKFGKKKVSNKKYKVTTKGKYNTNKIGKYTVEYNVKYLTKKIDLKRNIIVYDNVEPELTLSAESVKKDYCTKKYEKEITYKAEDNYDGDITDKVTVKEEENKITYSVSDQSGNGVVKEVKIDYGSKPSNKFTLNGKAKLTIKLNGTYSEQGASYTDGCGNKINKEIKITGNVDTSKEGEYVITYSVDGEKDITRVIAVKEQLYSPKTIYLTFDDGPGANTKRVLATLDKYNVKATFFVTNQFGGYRYLIGEEYRKGHAVGVHTLTHNWNVYDSVDAYINDFNAMNEIIKEQTGSYSKIFRFPGGSGNTVSKSHSAGVVSAIAAEMTNRGYVYYDWNLSSGDAESKPTSSKIISNVVNRVDSCRNQCVILFHDYKKVTADALDPILAELTSRGYSFGTLDENGPLTHATIKN